MSFIQCEQITRSYGHGASIVSAVDHISFDMDSGEFVAIMGESGRREIDLAVDPRCDEYAGYRAGT